MFLVPFALVSAACGVGSSATTDRPTTLAAVPASAVAAPAPGHYRAAEQLYVGSTRTTAGAEPWTLVNVAGFGILTVTCSHSGQASVTFTVRSLASTVVSVSTAGGATTSRLANPGGVVKAPTGPAGPMSQTWQITPVTSADVPVATIRVASMPAFVSAGGCFASAQAVAGIATG